MRLDLYGYIGDTAGTIPNDIDAKSVIGQIQNAGGSETIEVHINSFGGSVYQGLAIYNALIARQEFVVVIIDAIAASMASVIAMAGKKIIMPENSMMMIHNPTNSVYGDADVLQKAIDELHRIERLTADIFAQRTGQPVGAILGMMAAETWLSAQEAVDLGFADEIANPASIEAFKRLDMRAAAYSIPSNIRAMCGHSESEDTMTTNTTSASADTKTTKTPAAAAAVTASHASVTPETANQIRAMVRGAKMDDTFATALINEGVTMDVARARVIDKLAADDMKADTRSGFAVLGGHDDPAFKAKVMAEALAARLIPNAKPSDQARQFMGASVMDMARVLCEARGMYRFGMSKHETVRAALTTSDFPELLQGAGNRVLLAAYEAAASGIKPLCRKRMADDFRTLSTLRVSEAPELLEVMEHAEVHHGAAGEASESYKVKTYARIFSLTRQAIINDDLGAFSDWMTKMGRAAAETEASLLFGLLDSNPVMNEDKKALFHANHGNLAAAGSAIDITSLGAARKALRTMKGLDGKTPINAEPTFLLVGPEKETEAEQVLATIAAAKSSDANPFSGRLQLAVEPRMGTSKAWYVFASPVALPVIEYAYLSQAEGPQLESRAGFEVMGMEFRVALDFGAGAVDWRGAYKNPGE